MREGRLSQPESSVPSAPITIKKYANRRLYNTSTSSYVTLEHLCQMVKDGVEFVVFDAKTNEDITRQVLTQIIVEEEAKGENLLPLSFLRQLISFYGNNMQLMVPNYLDEMMRAFAANHDRMTKAMQDTVGGYFNIGNNMEELQKQNVAMFERTMRMFSPFTPGKEEEAPSSRPTGPSEQIGELREQVESLRKQLEELSKRR